MCIYEVMCTVISKENITQTLLLHSPSLFINILHHDLSRKHFQDSNQGVPLFSIVIHSHGTILLSLNYISIGRQFSEETQFEFLLHLATLNWTEMLVITKGHGSFWQLCGSCPKSTQCLNFIFPWNFMCALHSEMTFFCSALPNIWNLRASELSFQNYNLLNPFNNKRRHLEVFLFIYMCWGKYLRMEESREAACCCRFFWHG